MTRPIAKRRLGSPPRRNCTVTFTTANGTATAGPDYVAQSNTVTFAPGTTGENLTIAGLDWDTLQAGDRLLIADGVLLGADVLLVEAERLHDELAGAGPLTAYLRDPRVTDVLVTAPDEVWVDRGTGLEPAPVRLRDEAAVRHLAQRLAAVAGRQRPPQPHAVGVGLSPQGRGDVAAHRRGGDHRGARRRIPRGMDECVAHPATRAQLGSQGIPDLERCGALAVNIAERGLVLAELPPRETPVAFVEMADRARAMLTGSLDALVRHDAAKARESFFRSWAALWRQQAIGAKLDQINFARRSKRIW